MTPLWPNDNPARSADMDGFTLLEVMVAVAILAVALTSIFSGQVGAFRASQRAMEITTAGTLARCKMGELEEKIAREGLPAVESTDTDTCCKDGPIENFECVWKIERVSLPDPAQPSEDEEDPAAPPSEADPDDLTGATPPSTGGFGEDATPASVLSGAMGGDMLGQLASQYAWPVLRPFIEEQVRRATVRVQWKVGSRTQGFDLVQFMVAHPGNGGAVEDDL